MPHGRKLTGCATTAMESAIKCLRADDSYQFHGQESSTWANYFWQASAVSSDRLFDEWIVLKAREEGLAGVTVLRGMMGFGAHSRLHTFKIERLSQDLPIIIEIVDTREKLEKFLSLIDNEIEEGMATLEPDTDPFLSEREGGRAAVREVRTLRTMTQLALLIAYYHAVGIAHCC